MNVFLEISLTLECLKSQNSMTRFQNLAVNDLVYDNKF